MKTKGYWMAGYLIAIFIFGVGALLYYQAATYVPVTPQTAPLNRYVFKADSPGHNVTHDNRLTQGELFFGRTVLPERVNVFSSNLKIMGIVLGPNPRAVVGLRNNPEQTWIVRPGSVVAGEKIIRLGKRYVMVRNGSGEGKVEWE